jgi:hypothetical protein
MRKPRPASSAEALRRIFDVYANQARKKDGVSLSMRRTSTELGQWIGEPFDNGTLGRWTRSQTRRHWRIPLFAIKPVCSMFGARQEEADELMELRLRELYADDRNDPALIAAAWLHDFLERTRSDQEKRLVKAFRKLYDVHPFGLNADGEERIKERLEELMGKHQEDEFAERQAESQDKRSDEDEAQRKRVREIIRKSAPTPKRPERGDHREAADRFLQELRKLSPLRRKK